MLGHLILLLHSSMQSHCVHSFISLLPQGNGQLKGSSLNPRTFQYLLPIISNLRGHRLARKGSSHGLGNKTTKVTGQRHAHSRQQGLSQSVHKPARPWVSITCGASCETCVPRSAIWAWDIGLEGSRGGSRDGPWVTSLCRGQCCHGAHATYRTAHRCVGANCIPSSDRSLFLVEQHCGSTPRYENARLIQGCPCLGGDYQCAKTLELRALAAPRILQLFLILQSMSSCFHACGKETVPGLWVLALRNGLNCHSPWRLLPPRISEWKSGQESRRFQFAPQPRKLGDFSSYYPSKP